MSNQMRAKWVEAKDLKPGDEFLYNDMDVYVIHINSIKNKKQEGKPCIEVSGVHHFIYKLQKIKRSLWATDQVLLLSSTPEIAKPHVIRIGY